MTSNILLDSDKTCGYNSLSNLLQDEGEKIGNPNGYNIGLDKCKQKCTDTYACKSFTWCSIGFTKCHMKGKIVNVDRYEPTKNDPNCKTYYPKDCIFGTYQIFQFLQFVVSILPKFIYHKN